MASVEATEVDSLRSKLVEAASKRTFGAKRAVSKTAKVRALRADIAGLRKRGASWAEVADVLKEAGLEASADTVRLAITDKKTSGASNGGSTATQTGTRKTTTGAKPGGKTGNKSAPFGAAGREL